MKESQYTITTEPARVAKVLAMITVGLVLLSVLGQGLKFFGGVNRGVDEFYVDAENNIPTYFASFLLLCAACLLLLIATWKGRMRDRFFWHWVLLSGLMLLLSIDEMASLHERLNRPLRTLLNVEGWFYYAWVIPGFVCVLLFALSYLSFLRHLPKPFQRLFLLAGTLYCAGVLGVELLGGHYTVLYGRNNFTYSLIATVEEALELSGSTLLIFTLLRYLHAYVPAIRLQVRARRSREVTDSVPSSTFHPAPFEPRPNK